MSGEMLQKTRPAGHRPALQRTCPCVTLLRNATLEDVHLAAEGLRGVIEDCVAVSHKGLPVVVEHERRDCAEFEAAGRIAVLLWQIAHGNAVGFTYRNSL